MADENPAYNSVRIREREIAPPLTISPQARQLLSDRTIEPRMVWPSPEDKDAWRARLASTDAARQKMVETMLASATANIETKRIGGVQCYDCTPLDGPVDDLPIYLFAHGGAFVAGGGDFAKAQGARAADGLRVRAVSVDYRMPPDHPFPAAPNDLLEVYKALIENADPRRIVIAGSSAGGNIAAATILMIRDQGLPMPAGAILMTPEVDLTESGDTFRTNEELDVILKGGLPECNALYAGGHDLRDPYLSPLFADYSEGFPPTLVQSGTRDLFLSNSVLLHRKLRKAGIDAELHVWEAMPHGGFGIGDTPENDEMRAEVARFIGRVIG
jgi:acetyl esterase/lipase